MSNTPKLKAVKPAKEPSLLETLAQGNFIHKLKPAMETGKYYVRAAEKAEDVRIAPTFVGDDTTTMWHFFNQDPTRHCDKYHMFHFGCLGIIPKRCFDCYKVVVHPDNIIDLFKLKGFFSFRKFNAKCGMETRRYTEHHYSGYVYLNDLESARGAAKTFNEEMHWKSTVKRGCTEFEMSYPDSSQWEYTKEFQAVEETLDSILDVDVSHKQSEMVQVDVQARWIQEAIRRKDWSVKELVGDVQLLPKIKTYLTLDME